MLPAAPTGLVATPYVAQARALAHALLEENQIGLLEGPAGTGKTTSAAQIAHEAGRPCAFVTMDYQPAPLDLLRSLTVALIGRQPTGVRWHLQHELVRFLRDWNGLLVVDEVQHAGLVACSTCAFCTTRPEERSPCSSWAAGWRRRSAP